MSGRQTRGLLNFRDWSKERLRIKNASSFKMLTACCGMSTSVKAANMFCCASKTTALCNDVDIKEETFCVSRQSSSR